jgi:hypothetical protein
MPLAISFAELAASTERLVHVVSPRLRDLVAEARSSVTTASGSILLLRIERTFPAETRRAVGLRSAMTRSRTAEPIKRCFHEVFTSKVKAGNGVSPPPR